MQSSLPDAAMLPYQPSLVSGDDLQHKDAVISESNAQLCGVRSPRDPDPQDHDTSIMTLTLPNEIISLIFEITRSSTRAPDELRLSSISRRFRSIALRTPLLWTDLFIDVMRSREPGRMAMASAYATRSGALPIRLHIHSDFSRMSPETLRGIRQIVTTYADRWWHLGVDFNSASALHYVIGELQGLAMPHLSSVLLDIPENLDETENPNALGAFFDRHGPSLVDLRLRNIALDDSTSPLTAIRSLSFYRRHDRDHLHDHPKTDIQLIMRLLNNIQLTHLVIDGDVFHGWNPAIVVTLPSLRSLHIRRGGVDVWHTEALLAAVSAPKLSTLVLEDMIEEDLIPVILNWISPDGTSNLRVLTSLTLTMHVHRSAISSLCWMSFFRALPAITEFSLARADCESFLDMLGPAPLAEPTWPLLHTLTLVESRDRSRSTPRREALLKAMLRLLSARIVYRLPIRCLKLSSLLMDLLGDDRLVGLRALTAVETQTQLPEWVPMRILPWSIQP